MAVRASSSHQAAQKSPAALVCSPTLGSFLGLGKPSCFIVHCALCIVAWLLLHADALSLSQVLLDNFMEGTVQARRHSRSPVIFSANVLIPS